MIPERLAEQLRLLAAARRRRDDLWMTKFDADVASQAQLRANAELQLNTRVTRLLEVYGEILAEEEPSCLCAHAVKDFATRGEHDPRCRLFPGRP